jgi:putative hemolysin
VNNPLLESIIILLLIIANGVFAMAEIAIVASRKSRLQQLAESGDAKAKAALELANHPNQFLSTIQIGITLIGILAGAFGGATLAEHLAVELEKLQPLAHYSKPISFGVVVIIITYLSLIIGELVPKRLGLNKPESVASFVAKPMKTFIKISMPLVRLLDYSSDLIVRMLGVKPSAEPSITTEELKALVEQGAETGEFERSEQEIIESVLRLDDKRVGAMMTPRTQIVWFDISDTPEQIQVKVAESQHSRFPVIDDNLDNVIGTVRAKNLLVQNLSNKPLDLKALSQPPLFIPESMSALKVLELFKQKATHIALVTDEYGVIQGMVTHNDILEAIIGDIPSESEPQAIQREDGSWLFDGLVSIDKLKELLDIKKLPDEEYSGYHTVGGFVMNQLHSIPTEGQHFHWNCFRFEVVDMDGRRVDKVLVSETTSPEPENE